jgi:hypothetical protein
LPIFQSTHTSYGKTDTLRAHKEVLPGPDRPAVNKEKSSGFIAEERARRRDGKKQNKSKGVVDGEDDSTYTRMIRRVARRRFEKIQEWYVDLRRFRPTPSLKSHGQRVETEIRGVFARVGWETTIE